MAEVFKFLLSFGNILSHFFFVRRIDKYIRPRDDNMNTLPRESIFKSIENMDKYTIVLFRKRSKILLLQQLQTIGEDENEMIFYAGLAEIFENRRQRRFRSIASGKKFAEILVNETKVS